MNNKYVAMVVVALVVVGGGSFYGGIQYDKSVTVQARTAARTQFGGNNNGGKNDQGGQGQTRGGMMGGRGQNGGGFITGEILSKDDKSLTIKTPDGGSTIVYFSATVNVRKANIGSLTDLSLGQQVTVNGRSSSDGSVVADTISTVPSVAK